MIDQTVSSFRNKCKPWPAKFRNHVLYNSEDNNVSSVILMCILIFNA